MVERESKRRRKKYCSSEVGHERARNIIHHKQAEFLAVSVTSTSQDNHHHLHQASLLSAMSQPEPPTLPPTFLKRAQLLWRALLITNFALTAYIITRPRKKKDGTEIHTRKGHKLQKEKTSVEAPEPPTTTTSVDSISDDD